MDIMIAYPTEKGINARISQKFGGNVATYKRFGLAGHNGWDLPDAVGTDVWSVADGKVIDVGDEGAKNGYGRYIKIQHDGFQTTYGHLSKQLVVVGQTVKAFEHIGEMGNTGFSTGSHVHLTLKETDGNGLILNKGNGFNGAIDPAPYLFDKWAIMAQKHVVASGISNGKNPNGTVTRVQLWRMLQNLSVITGK